MSTLVHKLRGRSSTVSRWVGNLELSDLFGEKNINLESDTFVAKKITNQKFNSHETSVAEGNARHRSVRSAIFVPHRILS